MAVHQLLRGRAKLGAIAVGGGGTIKKIGVGTFTLNPASINTLAVGETDFTLTGAAVGDIVVVNPPAALDDGLVWNAFVTADNTVQVRIYNSTGGSVDVASATWSYLWFDRT